MARSASGFSLPAIGGSGSAAAAIAVALLAPAPAWALFQDRLEIWAAENLTHDSNVFRISDRVSPTVIGALKLSDTISTTRLGASADYPFSQQRLQASYEAFASRYRNFKDLNNDGHTARAQLLWSLTHRLTGTAGYQEAKMLASFANIQGRTPDTLNTRQTWLTGNWEVNPSWHATGGLAAAQNKHGDPSRRLNDIETTTGELGVLYSTPSQDSVGLVTRVETGQLPRATTISGQTFDNSYRQYGTGVTGAWILTGHSRVEGRAELVRRTYEQATERNYSGPIARALYTWTPTGKLTVVAAALREFGPADEINSALVVVKGSYVRPVWTLTDKVTIQGNLEYNVSNFRGDPLTGLSFIHRERLYGASVTWRPFRKILLSAGVNRDTRFSTEPLGDFDVTVAFVEGRIAF